MGQLENKPANSSGAQRERVMSQLAGVQSRLEKNGVGAAFHRVAKADPVGDMGLVGSIFLHAMMGGPLGSLLGGHMGGHMPLGHGELDTTLTLGTVEAASTLSDTQEKERHVNKRPKCAFYPLGRNKKAVKAAKASGKAAANSSGFSNAAQSELAFMFELMDTLTRVDAQDTGKVADKSVHLIVRKSASPAYQGVERRRRPRPEGMFNA